MPSVASWRPFVVQHHTGCGAEHFDLMLDADEVLWTWQLDAPLPRAGQGPVAARRIADHRRDYLTYEGPISGGRGQCRIVVRGQYRLLAQEDGALRIETAGHPGSGLFALRSDAGGPGVLAIQREAEDRPAGRGE